MNRTGRSLGKLLLLPVALAVLTGSQCPNRKEVERWADEAERQGALERYQASRDHVNDQLQAISATIDNTLGPTGFIVTLNGKLATAPAGPDTDEMKQRSTDLQRALKAYEKLAQELQPLLLRTVTAELRDKLSRHGTALNNAMPPCQEKILYWSAKTPIAFATEVILKQQAAALEVDLLGDMIRIGITLRRVMDALERHLR